MGEQAEQEFKRYEPEDDNRLFQELYGVTRLSSSFIPTNSQVYISTIQRLYSILKDRDLDERDEEENPEEKKWTAKEPMPVVYNERTPMEFFDVIVIDECHRSIYNLWKQVLDYFDAFQIGLTATPDNRTFGYFNQNLVCDYGYQKEVEDGVLVPYNVFEIATRITQQGSELALGEYVGSRLRVALLIKTRIRSLNPSELHSMKAKGKPKKAKAVFFTTWVFDARLAIGIGEVPKTVKQLATTSSEAFFLSGHLLDEMKNRKQSLDIGTDDKYSDELETEMLLLDNIIAKTTALQCEVIHWKLWGLPEIDIANKLGIGQSAVNQRSNSGSWNAISAMVDRFETIYGNE